VRGAIAALLVPALVSCAATREETRSTRVVVRATPDDAALVKIDKDGRSELGQGQAALEGSYEVTVGTTEVWTFVLPPLTLGVLGGGVALAIDENTRGIGATAAVMGAIWTTLAFVKLVNDLSSNGDVLSSHPSWMQIEASREGFATETERISFGPDTKAELAIELRALPPPRLAKAPEPEEKPETRSMGMIGTLGVGAGGGGFGVGLGGLGGSKRIGPGRGEVIAVFDLRDDSKSLSSKVLSQATEYLRSRLASDGGFRVVPNDQLRAAIKDKKKASYASCIDESCQIELGRAVAAQKSLATKIVRVGKSCSLSLILYDLKTETSERAATIKMPCTADGLTKAIDEGI
jgi:hypothetical protein